MKYLFLISLGLSSPNLFAEIEATTRVFKVNWTHPEGSDQDIQMCDDGYFSAAEILVPTSPSGFEPSIISEQCSQMKVKKLSSVVEDGKNYFRFRLTGPWDCEIIFEKPITNRSPEASIYTITLGDSC